MFKAYRDKLVKAGKPIMVAIIAVARKLLSILKIQRLLFDFVCLLRRPTQGLAHRIRVCRKSLGNSIIQLIE